jgi:hypothetical protein
MTKSNTYLLLGEAKAASSEETFVAEWATSSLFDPDPDAAAPDYEEIVRYLRDIWTAAHVTIKEIRQHTGLTQAAFSQCYAIPKRSLENWERASGTEARSCPPYLILLLAQVTGLVDVL